MTQIKATWFEAKGTWQLTKSQLLPNIRDGIIAQTNVTQSNNL
jgi:hypothetical protein